MLEPFVSRRLDEALRRQEQALGRMPPNRHALVEQADLRVRHRGRIAYHFRHQFEESAPHGRGVAHPDLPGGRLPRQEPLHEALTLARDRLKLIRDRDCIPCWWRRRIGHVFLPWFCGSRPRPGDEGKARSDPTMLSLISPVVL